MWKRLRKKKLKVVGAPVRPKKRSGWSEAEDAAVVRRHKARETDHRLDGKGVPTSAMAAFA